MPFFTVQLYGGELPTGIDAVGMAGSRNYLIGFCSFFEKYPFRQQPVVLHSLSFGETFHTDLKIFLSDRLGGQKTGSIDHIHIRRNLSQIEVFVLFGCIPSDQYLSCGHFYRGNLARISL